MLQQTQVSTVIPYFERFMQRFPDVHKLAAAPLDEVLHLWSGLGYYARARNLHRAAQEICEQHDGKFPADFDAACALPGIGRSTAGAVLALALGQRHPILDGNAKRVLARHAKIAGWPGTSAVAKTLWDLADERTPDKAVAEYTQAIMDLGATLCTRRNPQCGKCPVAADCRARLDGDPQDYPGRKPRQKNRRLRHTRMLLAVGDDGVLLQKRPAAGIWGGLWSLPELDDEDSPDQWCRQRLGRRPRVIEDLPVMRHSFTHYDLDILPVVARLDGAGGTVAESECLWYNAAAPAEVGLAAPVSMLLQQVDWGNK